MSTTAPRRLLRLLVGLASLVLLWTVGSALPASAHAGLVDTEPASGTVMEAAPRDLRLNFNEPVAPISIRLLNGDGTSPPSALRLRQSAPGEAANG